MGRRVVVIGGGNVAVDVARTAARGGEQENLQRNLSIVQALDVARSAVRFGAREVTVCCLESESEMPAAPDEVEEAGPRGCPLPPPPRAAALRGRERHAHRRRASGTVSRIFDETGRFAPQFVDGSETMIPADTVIMAIGQTGDLSFLAPEDGVATRAGDHDRPATPSPPPRPASTPAATPPSARASPSTPSPTASGRRVDRRAPARRAPSGGGARRRGRPRAPLRRGPRLRGDPPPAAADAADRAPHRHRRGGGVHQRARRRGGKASAASTAGPTPSSSRTARPAPSASSAAAARTSARRTASRSCRWRSSRASRRSRRRLRGRELAPILTAGG